MAFTGYLYCWAATFEKRVWKGHPDFQVKARGWRKKEEIQVLFSNASDMAKEIDLLQSENDGLRFANEKLNTCNVKLYASKTINELDSWDFIWYN